MPTVSLQVLASADDATDADDGSNFSTTGTTGAVISSTTASTRRNSGFRFVGVPISNTATILSATWTATTDGSTTSILATFYGEAADNAANYTTTAAVYNRTKTSASVAWDSTGLSKSTAATSPDLTTIIQEVVSRTGWKNGNALNLILAGQNSATGRTAAFVTADSSPAPTLDISWTRTTTATLFRVGGGSKVGQTHVLGGIIPAAVANAARAMVQYFRRRVS